MFVKKTKGRVFGAEFTAAERKAMEMAGMPNRETSIYKMVYNCLMKLLPERK